MNLDCSLNCAAGFCAVPVGLPIELTVSEVTSTSATILWSCASLKASDIDECEISYGLQNDTVYMQSSFLPESYSLFLSNLSAESTYQLYVVCYSAGLLHKSDVLIFSTKGNPSLQEQFIRPMFHR
jgi:Fibronectin type III domain